VTKEERLRIENDILRARCQDFAVMVLEGRDTREDEPVRMLSQGGFMKVLSKLRKHFGPDGGTEHES
jgi:hypothetical protein